jgi:signal transduction histidine kinase
MDEEGKRLGDMLSTLLTLGRVEEGAVMGMAKSLEFSLDASENPVALSLERGESFIISSAKEAVGADRIVAVLGHDNFLIVPLVAEGRKLGAIIADNFVTKRPIGTEDVQLLETLASQAALAIANALLHSDLESRLRELEAAHEELATNHLQLLRAERLVALGGLTSTLVHDLRAPIISIGMLAREALAGLCSDTTSSTGLEAIIQEVGGIESYLRQLSACTTRGRREPEPVDIRDLVEESLHVISGLTEGTGIATTIRLNHGSGRIWGDRLELRQTMLNLLCNAVEAMPEGGRLSIESSVEDGMLHLSVTDTGVGISDHDRPEIFSAFFSTKSEGSGLGLFMARRVITDYGGTITCQAVEGGGTRFSIHLPVIEPAEESGRDANP